MGLRQDLLAGAVSASLACLLPMPGITSELVLRDRAMAGGILDPDPEAKERLVHSHTKPARISRNQPAARVTCRRYPGSPTILYQFDRTDAQRTMVVVDDFDDGAQPKETEPRLNTDMGRKRPVVIRTTTTARFCGDVDGLSGHHQAQKRECRGTDRGHDRPQSEPEGGPRDTVADSHLANGCPLGAQIAIRGGLGIAAVWFIAAGAVSLGIARSTRGRRVALGIVSCGFMALIAIVGFFP